MTPYHHKIVKALKQLGLVQAASNLAELETIPQGRTLSQGIGQLSYRAWLQPAYEALVKAEERNKEIAAIFAQYASLTPEDLNFKPANNENLLTLYTSKVKKSVQNEALYAIFYKVVHGKPISRAPELAEALRNLGEEEAADYVDKHAARNISGTGLLSAFAWSDTPQGHIYWSNLDLRLHVSLTDEERKACIAKRAVLVSALCDAGHDSVAKVVTGAILERFRSIRDLPNAEVLRRLPLVCFTSKGLTKEDRDNAVKKLDEAFTSLADNAVKKPPLINMHSSYVTKDGRPARVLCVDYKHPRYPVVVAVQDKHPSCQVVAAMQDKGREFIYLYDKTGLAYGKEDDNRNLVQVTK